MSVDPDLIPFAPELPKVEPWFESTADLLTEDDPGPTPFLIEDLLVEASMAAFVGPPKKGKTWTLLDLAIAVATGERALGRFHVAEPGPVLLILEESGRAALHRRLDKLARGRAVLPGRLKELYFAANRRVRLDDDEWRGRLLDAASAKPWRLIAFDPLARVKGLVDENVQHEVGPVLDFLRELRATSNATVLYVHHTGHEGTRHRGSSDFESYWESKLTLIQTQERRTLMAEHREAEGAGPFELAFAFDSLTGTLRLTVSEDELDQRVQGYLDQHPGASANEVYDAVGGNRRHVLELVKRHRAGGSETLEPPGTTHPGQRRDGGSPAAPHRGAGTTPTDPIAEVVPDGQNHSSLNGWLLPGDSGYLDRMFTALQSEIITAGEWRQADLAHRFVTPKVGA